MGSLVPGSAPLILRACLVPSPCSFSCPFSFCLFLSLTTTAVRLASFPGLLASAMYLFSRDRACSDPSRLDFAVSQDALSNPWSACLCVWFPSVTFFSKTRRNSFFFSLFLSINQQIIRIYLARRVFAKLLLCFECYIQRIALISSTIPLTHRDPHTHCDPPKLTTTPTLSFTLRRITASHTLGFIS